MKPRPERERIKVWRLPGVENLELHRGLSVARSYPRHWHEEFHFCVIEAGAGELHYRGTTHPTPAGCMFMVHPGEVHANRAYEEAGCTFRNLYVGPERFHHVAQEVGRQRNLPFFASPVLFDASLIRHYLHFHRSVEASASRLEQESLLLSLLARLLRRSSAGQARLRSPGRERLAVRRVREYLNENYAENVSLERLAGIASLSPFHLNRVFRSEMGLPPHAFQTQVRVLRAKTLLQKGCAVAQAACDTGFADQSHLTRHFKRLVGIPPGEYLRCSASARGYGQGT